MPPHSGSLAYCVLQKERHRQPASFVGTLRVSVNAAGERVKACAVACNGDPT